MAETDLTDWIAPEWSAETYIKAVQERDRELEALWGQFADVPCNPETECIEEPFHIWKAGTHREEIWKWFDRRYSKGVAYLLYGDAADIPEVSWERYQQCWQYVIAEDYLYRTKETNEKMQWHNDGRYTDLDTSYGCCNEGHLAPYQTEEQED